MTTLDRARTASKANTAQMESIGTLVPVVLTLAPRPPSASLAPLERNAQALLRPAKLDAELESSRLRAKTPVLPAQLASSVLTRMNLSSHVRQEHTAQAQLRRALCVQLARSALVVQIAAVFQSRTVTLDTTQKMDGPSASPVPQDTSAREVQTRFSVTRLSMQRPDLTSVSAQPMDSLSHQVSPRRQLHQLAKSIHTVASL